MHRLDNHYIHISSALSNYMEFIANRPDNSPLLHHISSLYVHKYETSHFDFYFTHIEVIYIVLFRISISEVESIIFL